MDSKELQVILARLDGFEKILNKLNTVQSETRKNPTDKLYEALAKAKLEYKPIRFNKENAFNKQVYADLNTLENATRGPLANNGLSLMHQPEDIDGTTFLFSILGHSSGQEIRIKNRLIVMEPTGSMSPMQLFGESLAYMKRQVTQAMLGLVANNDPEDNDDANTSAFMYSNASQTSTVKVDASTFHERITKDQLDDLHYELNDYPIMTSSLLKSLEIRQLADMPKAKFQSQMQHIRKQKNALSNAPQKEW